MASPVIAFEELVRTCEVTESCLDREVPEIQFWNVSGSLSKWRLIAPMLKVTEADVEAIETDNSKEENRRVGFLKRWKQKESFRATYKSLVCALLGIHRVEDARGLCQLLKESSKASPLLSNNSTFQQLSSPIPSFDQPPPFLPSVPAKKKVVESSEADIAELEKDIDELQRKFEDLVDSVEDSFQASQVSLEKLKRSIKHFPISLKRQLGEYFADRVSKILNAESIRALFVILSFHWDYLNPGLLHVIVGRFGSKKDDLLMSTYMIELDEFLSHVKVGDYVRTRYGKEDVYDKSFYKNLFMIAQEEIWGKRTLKEAVMLIKELSKTLSIQPLLARYRFSSSSIAIVFRVPRWFPIDIKELEEFFIQHYIVEVHLNNGSEEFVKICDEMSLKLKNTLSCSLCHKIHNNPKFLECFHIFCHDCLEKIVIKDEHGQFLACPSCHHITPLTFGGISELLSANHFLEPQVEDSTEDIAASYCAEHAGQKLDMFCTGCDILICMKCKDHYQHGCEPLLHIKKPKTDVNLSLEPIKKQLATMVEILTEVEVQCAAIERQRTQIEALIQQTAKDQDGSSSFEHLQQERKDELIQQLQQLFQCKLKSLEAQRTIIQSMKVRLQKFVEFMEESLRTCSEEDILKVHTYVVKKVKKLTTTFEPKILELGVKEDIFAAARCELIYSLSSSCFSTLTKENLVVAEIGKEFSCSLYFVKKEIQPHIKCTLVHNFFDFTAVHGSVSRVDADTCKIIVLPQTKGIHQLHITVDGKHIRGSPFEVAVGSSTLPVTFSKLSTISLFRPSGIAVTQKGNIIVVDKRYVFVQFTYSTRQRILRSDSSHIAVDKDDNILLCKDYQICRYTFEGTLLQSSRSYHSTLQGIAFNVSNHKIYLSYSNHEVRCLNFDLSLFSSFGKEGKGIGEFKSPKGIACDNDGNVYVVDSGNYRIQVFSAEGKFLHYFGERGEGPGQLCGPSGIAIDHNFNVFVSDYNLRHVSIFTSKGQYITSFHMQFHRRLLSFSSYTNLPIAVDFCGTVYVCVDDGIQLY